MSCSYRLSKNGSQRFPHVRVTSVNFSRPDVCCSGDFTANVFRETGDNEDLGETYGHETKFQANLSSGTYKNIANETTKDFIDISGRSQVATNIIDDFVLSAIYVPRSLATNRQSP